MSYLTVAEVAERCRVSESTVYALVKRGELPATRIGRRMIIAETALTEYIDRNTAKSRPPAAPGETAPVVRRTSGVRRYR